MKTQSPIRELVGLEAEMRPLCQEVVPNLKRHESIFLQYEVSTAWLHYCCERVCRREEEWTRLARYIHDRAVEAGIWREFPDRSFMGSAYDYHQLLSMLEGEQQ